MTIVILILIALQILDNIYNKFLIKKLKERCDVFDSELSGLITKNNVNSARLTTHSNRLEKLEKDIYPRGGEQKYIKLN